MNKQKASRKYNKKKILIIILSIVACLIAIHFVIGPMLLNYRLSSEVTSARDKVDLSDNEGEAIANLLEANNLIVDKKPVYQWFFDACHVDHDDGGWIAQNYNQKCSTGFIWAYELNTESDSVIIEEVKKEREALNKDGYSFRAKPTPYKSRVNMDFFSKFSHQPRPRLRNGESIELPPLLNAKNEIRSTYSRFYSAYITLPDIDTSFQSIVKDHSMYPFVIPAYAYDSVSIKTYSESSSPGIDTSQKQYVIISQANSYFHKKLGCKPGGLLFCESPLKDKMPVHPDLKK